MNISLSPSHSDSDFDSDSDSDARANIRANASADANAGGRASAEYTPPLFAGAKRRRRPESPAGDAGRYSPRPRPLAGGPALVGEPTLAEHLANLRHLVRMAELAVGMQAARDEYLACLEEAGPGPNNIFANHAAALGHYFPNLAPAPAAPAGPTPPAPAGPASPVSEYSYYSPPGGDDHLDPFELTAPAGETVPESPELPTLVPAPPVSEQTVPESPEQTAPAPEPAAAPPAHGRATPPPCRFEAGALPALHSDARQVAALGWRVLWRLARAGAGEAAGVLVWEILAAARAEEETSVGLNGRYHRMGLRYLYHVMALGLRGAAMPREPGSRWGQRTEVAVTTSGGEPITWSTLYYRLMNGLKAHQFPAYLEAIVNPHPAEKQTARLRVRFRGVAFGRAGSARRRARGAVDWGDLVCAAAYLMAADSKNPSPFLCTLLGEAGRKYAARTGGEAPWHLVGRHVGLELDLAPV